MRNYWLLCSLLLFMYSFSNAQDKMKWGQIPLDYFDIKSCPFDKDAASMVLKERGVIEFAYVNGWKINLSKHRRVKVFDKSASEEGNYKIRYYHKYRIKSLRAQVIAPDGTISVVAKKDIFDEKINKYYYSKNFALPNIEDGSIIEVSYIEESTNLSQLFEWYFQEDIPILKSELSVVIPSYFEYLYLFQGSQSPKVDIETRPNINFGLARNGGTRYRMVMDSVPAIKEEAFITTMDNYKNRVRFQLSSILDQYGVSKPYLSSWEEVSKDLIEDGDFGKRYNAKSNYKKANEALLVSNPGLHQLSPKEKLAKIYKFVQDNMEWNRFTALYSQVKLDDPFQKGKGTVSQINLLLTALLRAHEIESNPILISTRTHGKTLQQYPILDQFNYLISSAKIDDELILLDGTSKFNPPGILPLKALNEYGFIITDTEGKWISIPSVKDKEKYLLKGKMDEEGNIIGSYAYFQDNFSAIDSRAVIKEKGKEQFKTDAVEAFGEIEVQDFNIENLEDFEKPLKSNFDCTISNTLSIAGNLAYMSPIFIKAFDESPFKLKERNYPVEIPFPFKEQFVLVLDLPENFAVEELPKSIKYSFPDNGGSFTYTSKQNGQQLIINSDLNINQTTFIPSQYKGLKQLFEKIIEKQNEQIVFKIN